MASWESMDQAAFRATTLKLVSHSPCLSEGAPRSLVAATHRLVGLALYQERDTPGAEAAFAAARLVEPAWSFPAALLPPGHPILLAYQARSPTTVVYSEAPRPREGTVSFDSRVGTARPSAVPTWFQRTDESGRVVASTYLFPTDALPPYDAARELVAQDAEAGHGSRTLAIAGGATALLAGAVYAAAGVFADDYRNSPQTDAELNSLRATTNTLVFGAAGLGAAAAGLGVGAVIHGRW